ncbi:glycogen/starch/alpha-glucan phosphorylase [Mycobacterium sp. CBMA293]|uniref:glycogen/starch/alpha-glucan phosphorylase n=1 Tax=unclassified Mycolicibacterium TaxID=2636767 RepID=UPI0012DFDDF7|nr:MULTISPECIES: glycogen/starch/alpha-glucan phosphorylase [unclassified Mycolicibacterium]MUL45628.1 glycogen/starch/alpha-glucan phosphorylase [Mycolicibacterium sp. CBMA 360]MUL60298.1 glycogen/starch/alpha-glucan phosphorylase [Mycolicibacterium sp. CBMA 335]MUL71490.1 glycogen/starch/alpha-glucan phosphorylase [Mycolicibacterium sp. CBMA 311]MUL73085.1 glycogen/starch/alpha-glucan phosphorylase [Mycolicibacterium sp. CBMA 311]MUL95940.1 glycogen/starch/alpha-glucan phosphorylase [Mycolic
MTDPWLIESARSNSADREDVRAGLHTDELRQAVEDHLLYSVGRPASVLTPEHYYRALSLAVRDRMQERWMASTQAFLDLSRKVTCYLSAEFLMGPQLGNNLLNLGIERQAREALAGLGHDLDEVLACEQEPGLGNGGLGRLAACYLDSLATLERPAIGYGIRYEFGIFKQEINNGWQVEKTDNWLVNGNPWEIAKPDVNYPVQWGGYTESYLDEHGDYRVRWIPRQVLKGISFDTPIQGYGVNTCNTLTLWSARAIESFALDAFNSGDYYRAVEDEVKSETVTKVLYPNDEVDAGKHLRLLQQYFFVSCSLQDILHILEDLADLSVEALPQQFALQLNDTHPSIAVAELMRLLVDERGLAWDEAWAITVATFGYTNHTLLPEALETWPLAMFKESLPRHLEIIYEINRRFLDDVAAKFPGDTDRLRRMSLIGEDNGKSVRMAHLATVGSHAVNGVAALHTELLKASVLKDFYEMWPERFSNKTNGVTPRRFLALSNPGLRDLLDKTVGPGWLTDLGKLRELEPLADNPAFGEQWRSVKRANKARLADYIQTNTGVELNPDWMFDIQVKRIHEYKRQHLNVLHIATLYHRLKQNPDLQIAPRAFVFGGKAAPGYFMAKRIIKLINAVAETVNADPVVSKYIKVAFVPNFNVQNAHLIYPAADLSEQISTAGKEASGTGNMKFMLNGALTIGTLDGANVEMRDEVGAENFFLFGLTEREVEAVKAAGYRPSDYIERDIEGGTELNAALNLIADGTFSGGDTDVFRPLVDSLRFDDPFLVLADYASYVACQDRVDAAWRNTAAWTRMSILNTARSGKFSSDRAITEYCDDIWDVSALTVR